MAEYIIYHLQLLIQRLQSNGQVIVSVPHDQAHKAIDQGALYDSTAASSAAAVVSSSSTSSSSSNPANTPHQAMTSQSSPSSSPSLSSSTQPSSSSSQPQQQQHLQQQLQSQQQQLQPVLPQLPSPSSPLPPVPLPLHPIANAGISQVVNANTTVILDGGNSYVPTQPGISSTSSSGRIIAYEWAQLRIGVPVSLVGANTPTPMFKADG